MLLLERHLNLQDHVKAEGHYPLDHQDLLLEREEGQVKIVGLKEKEKKVGWISMANLTLCIHCSLTR